MLSFLNITLLAACTIWRRSKASLTRRSTWNTFKLWSVSSLGTRSSTRSSKHKVSTKTWITIIGSCTFITKIWAMSTLSCILECCWRTFLYASRACLIPVWFRIAFITSCSRSTFHTICHAWGAETTINT